METFIKLLLAFMLIFCLTNMPYGYYELVRYIGFCGFAILADKSFTKGKPNQGTAWLGLALLFQPFFKLALGKEIWNIVDIIVIIGLVVSMFNRKGDE